MMTSKSASTESARMDSEIRHREARDLRQPNQHMCGNSSTDPLPSFWRRYQRSTEKAHGECSFVWISTAKTKKRVVAVAAALLTCFLVTFFATSEPSPLTSRNANPQVSQCEDDHGGHSLSCEASGVAQDYTLVQSDAESPSRLSKLPVCLFLHGAHVQGARPTQFKTSSSDVSIFFRPYWGSFNHWYADLCESFLYSYADTDLYSWKDSHLQWSFYEKAKEVTEQGGIVIAHSMANGILAGACYYQGKCVRWYGLGGAFSGEIIASVGLTMLKPLGIDHAIGRSFDLWGDGMRASSQYNGGMAKFVHDNKLLKGSVCGTKPTGNALAIGSKYQAANLTDFHLAHAFQNAIVQSFISGFFGMLGTMLAVALWSIGEDSEYRSDGVVEVATCAFYRESGLVGDKTWFGGNGPWREVGASDDIDDPFILAPVNHAEQTGVFTNTPVIMSWMRNMMCRELTSQGKQCPNKST